jgi:flagellum-specific ATP synthase
VFTLLPKLCERAGTSANQGSITGLYTVLVEGDDTNEPIADALRSILDGHINLTRELSTQNHYPAIDVLSSISRVMDDIIESEHRQSANKLKEILAIYRKAEDLINIGAYVDGSNPKIDYAIKMIEKINQYLRQEIDETTDFNESISQLVRLFES